MQGADEVVAGFAQDGDDVGWDAFLEEQFVLVARGLHFGLHLREEEHFLDERLARHEHGETVYADANTAGGRHAVLQGAQEVVVDDHCLVVTLVSELHLLDETLLLVDGVVQLGVGIRQLLAVYHQLEAFGQSGLGAVHLRQGRHLDGIVRDEGRLDERAFAELAK